MGGRDPLEEDLGFVRINVEVDPPSPRCQALVKRNQAVHILVQFVPLLDITPPGITSTIRSVYQSITKDITD